MRILLDRWRRTAFAQYFASVPSIDQQTFWVVAALALALALAVQALTSHG